MIAEHKYKLFEWSRLVQEQKNSGMTVMEWCQSTGVQCGITSGASGRFMTDLIGALCHAQT